MIIQPVQCNHCGAPLEVPESARFATCRHCGSQLAIHRSASAVTTEVLERVANQVDQVALEVKRLKLESELSRLERGWERERERYLVSNKHGVRHEPSETGGIISIVIAGIIALVAISMGGFGIVIGLLAGGIGCGVGVYHIKQAQDLRAARRSHDRRRASVLSELQNLDSPPTGDAGGESPWEGGRT